MAISSVRSNSFQDSTNPNSVAPKTPAQTIGSVTRKKVAWAEAPRSRAASSTDSSYRLKIESITRKPKGRAHTT